MINLLIGFTFGFVACLGIWLKRSIEQCRAFDAADDQIRMLRERERRYQQVLSIIRQRAHAMEEILDLGEVAPPPAIAKQSTGRQSTPFTLLVSSGSTRPRRSRFFRRAR